MKLKFASLGSVAIALISLAAFGHGEDKAGPHGGFVRMPGAYHTEVVPSGNDQIQVYLLDVEWKNPSTENSSVELSFPKKKNLKISCTATEAKAFSCPLPKGLDLKSKGILIVHSKREGQTGNEAKYDLPLKLDSPHDMHGGHH